MITLPKELEELKNFNNWVCYRLEPRPTKDDPAHMGKVPYNPKTGQRAKANDPRTWAGFKAAVDAVDVGYYDGVGFELGTSGYCGIDIDHCVDGVNISQWGEEVARMIDSYTEYSISGTGLHIIAKSTPLERTGYMSPKINNPDIDLEIYRPIEKKGGSFAGEVEGGRFLTISGKVYGDAKPIEDRTEQVKALITTCWPEEEKAPSPVGSSLPVKPDADAEKKMLVSALNAINPEDLDFAAWAAVCSAMKACGFSADDAEEWSADGGRNSKHVDGTIGTRWNSFHLREKDNSNAGAVIVGKAKQFGWTAADAFTDEERRQYGIDLHAPTEEDKKKYGSFLRERAEKERQKQKAAAEDPANDEEKPAADEAQEEQEADSAKGNAAPVLKRFSSVADYIAGGLMDADIKEISEYGKRKTGFKNLDTVQSFFPGLYVLGAIPSLGKTTFAWQMAENIAAAGDHVLYFTLEQTRLELVTKSLSRRMYAAYQGTEFAGECKSAIDIRRGLASNFAGFMNQKNNLIKSVSDRLSIVDVEATRFNYTVEDIINDIENYKKEKGATPVVFVDYLQIISPTLVNGRPGDIRSAIDHIVHVLKAYQSKEKIVFVLICSFNRNNYYKQVDFESFKESGGIEYTADVVWGLQLCAMGDKIFDNEKAVNEQRRTVNRAQAEIPRHIELYCLKNRFGKARYRCGFYYNPIYDSIFVDTSFHPEDKIPFGRGK